jgi:chromatin assembly factor 1 subunit B
MLDLNEQDEEMIDTAVKGEKTPVKPHAADELLKLSQSRMFLDDVEY